MDYFHHMYLQAIQYSQEKGKCSLTGFEVRADVIPWQACGSLKP